MREWSKLTYYDPRRTLIDLRAIEVEFTGQPIDPRILTLRMRTHQMYNHWRQAALFCHGMSQLTGTTVFFAPHEAEAHDCITLRKLNDIDTYTPVQLKELVPVHTNPSATLDDLLSGLTKYSTASDTVVAIYINRRQTMDLSSIHSPKLNLGGLWLFWGAGEDQSRWQLYGDVLAEPELHDFSYPA